MVIVLINHVSWDDLTQTRVPHLQQLIGDGAVGWMNAKTLSKYYSSGSYLTIGMSNRAKVDENVSVALDIGEIKKDTFDLDPVHQSFNQEITGETSSNGIIVPGIAQLRTQVRKTDPGSTPGMLGQLLKDHGVQVALFGNADIPGKMHREAALMMMDTTGWIPYGDISKATLQMEPSGLTGYRTDYQALFSKIISIANRLDLIVIETGDTSRLEYSVKTSPPTIRRRIIEEIDPFIGRLLKEVQPNNLLVLCVTPNKDMIQKGNTGLTPILLYGEGKGFLTSASTRRIGYVTNLDLAATICCLVGVRQDRIGKGSLIRVESSNFKFNKLIKEEVFFRNLRMIRYPMNLAIMIIYFIGILGGAIIVGCDSFKQYVSLYLLGVIALLMLPLGILSGWAFGYSSLWLPIGIILGVSFIGAFVLLKAFSFQRAMIVPLIVVPLILLVDAFHGGQLMLHTVMGSDIIAGGRFYGIGNDLMGVVIGSLTAGIGLLLQEYPILRTTARWWGSILFFLASVGIGLPGSGANVGGMLTALMTWITMIVAFSRIKISLSKWISAFISVIVLVSIIACGDAFLNPSPTHLGRTILLLIDQGSTGFFQIIKVKLSILGGTLIGSWWSLLLFGELVTLSFVKNRFPDFLPLLKRIYPFWWMMMFPLGTGCAISLIFNDTGVIPAALILSYFWLPSLGLYLYHDHEEKVEGTTWNENKPFVNG